MFRCHFFLKQSILALNKWFMKMRPGNSCFPIWPPCKVTTTTCFADYARLDGHPWVLLSALWKLWKMQMRSFGISWRRSICFKKWWWSKTMKIMSLLECEFLGCGQNYETLFIQMIDFIPPPCNCFNIGQSSINLKTLGPCQKYLAALNSHYSLTNVRYLTQFTCPCHTV